MKIRALIAAIAAFAFIGNSQAQTLVLEFNSFIAAPSVPIPSVAVVVGIPPGSVGIGDNRGPEDAGTSRITQTVVINTETWAVITTPAPVAGQSIMKDSSGTTIATGYATLETLTSTVATPTWGTMTWHITGNPKDPLVPGAPGITYDFIVTVYRNPGHEPAVVVTDAVHDRYPSITIKYQWNGNPKTLIYYASETGANALWPNPIATLNGTPPINYHMYGVPYSQRDQYVLPYDFIHTWLVDHFSDGIEPTGHGSDDTAGVVVYPTDYGDYQDTNGNWHDWSS